MMGEEEKEELKAKLQCLSSLVSSLKKKHDNAQTERHRKKPNRNSNNNIVATRASSSSKVWVRNTIKYSQQPTNETKIPKVTPPHNDSKSFNMKEERTAFKANVWRRADGSSKSSFLKPSQIQKTRTESGPEIYSKSKFRLNRLPSPKKSETSPRKSISCGNLMSLASDYNNKDEAKHLESSAHDSLKFPKMPGSSAEQVGISLFPSPQARTDHKSSNKSDFLRQNTSVTKDILTRIAERKKSSNLLSTNTNSSLSPSKHVWKSSVSSSNVERSRNILNSPVKSSEVRMKKINLSKHVWTKKREGDSVSSEKHKWMKSSVNADGSKNTKATTFVGSTEKSKKSNLYSWTSNESKNSSFLRRRSMTVIKQSRFALVRSYGSDRQIQKINFSHSDNKSSATSYKYLRKPTGNRSFIRRRMQFVASKSPELFKQTNVWNSPKQFKVTNTKYSKTNVASPKRKAAGGREVSNILFNVRGTKFQTDAKGRKLRRVLSTEYNNKDKHTSSIIRERPRYTEKKILNRYKLVTRNGNKTPTKEVTKVLASRVLRKSVAHLYHTKLKRATKTEYCMFYNRFGKCKNGKNCRYIHDPDKVAICTRFLRGTCKIADGTCLFSHKIDSQKMPTCSFFLRGMCHKDGCPYAHVKVSQSADVCKEFLKGHCPKGNECLKKHIRECDEYSKTGKCSLGKSCKLIHRTNPRKRKRSSSSSGTKIPKPFRKSAKQNRIEHESESVDDGLADPMRTIGVPSELIMALPIATADKRDTTGTSASEILQIKPQFLMTENSERFAGRFSRLKRKREIDRDIMVANVSESVSDTQEKDEKKDL